MAEQDMNNGNGPERLTNHLLNWWIQYYGNIGAQIRYRQWSDPKSVMNFLGNITISLWLLYEVHVVEPFWSEVESFGDAAKQRTANQALTSLLSTLTNLHLELFLLYHMFYYHFAGNSLYRVLASRPFLVVYSSRYRSGVIFGWMFIFTTVLYVAFLAPVYWFPERPFRSLMRVVCMHTLNFYFIYPLIIFHYVKYATLFQMRSILRRLEGPMVQRSHQNRSRTIDSVAILEEIKLLINLNKRISQILSLSMFGFIVCTIQDTIYLVYYFQLGRLFILEITYMSIYWLHILYLVQTDVRIDGTFRKIIRRLLERKFRPEVRPKFTEMKIRAYIKQIRLIEFYKLYSEDFFMCLFQICRVDFVFFTDCCLFTLAYLILAIQTSHVD